MSNLFHSFRKNFRDTRGVSLLVVFGLTVVLILISGTVTKLVLGFIQTTAQVERANKAFFAAESGIELALYDLMAYKDGYQTDSSQLVCDDQLDLNSNDNSGLAACDNDHQYRFVDFADEPIVLLDTDASDDDLSGARGFWRIFARTLKNVSNEYLIPNPYFAGNKDGVLTSDEWGELTKRQPLNLSLLTDANPNQISQPEPQLRFDWVSDVSNTKIIFDPGPDWAPNFNGNDQDELFIWTFSAIDGNSIEHTLQGVAWESDITNQDCDDSGVIDANEFCFIFDLDTSSVLLGADGDVYAGEDISQTLLSPQKMSDLTDLNRVSAVEESFSYATPKDYLTKLGEGMNGIETAFDNPQWRSAQLTISLIATLSETSGIPTNSLRYKLVSDESWSDEYNYIVSQGFAGDVKQTIETRFRRASAIPIFSYVIFQ
ncbi:MAG: pilus assembly PilX N-terminal domain-containing protein [Patescibacteria group bacterium]